MRFNVRRGQFVVDWIEKHLRLWEGVRKPIQFKDWQYECTMRMFGWMWWCEKFPSGKPAGWARRFKRASIFVPKKSGKTPSAAAWAIYLMCADGESGQHVFFAAIDGIQARLAGKHAIEMVKASPALSGQVTINLTKMQLTHNATLSTALPISSGDKRAAKAKQGLNGCVILDEIHGMTNSFVSESSIDQAGISRDEPLHIEISTAGKDPDSYGKAQYDHGKLVERGEIDDPHLFFISYEAPQDLTDEALAADPLKWGRMANPSMGRITQEHEFLATYNQKKGSLADLADFKTFRLNIWQQAASPWIRKADWDACEGVFADKELEGQTCCAGLDLAITRDMSALAFVFKQDDDRFRGLCKFYMPEEGMRRLAERVPQVHEWVRDGWLTVTPGATTDYRFIKRDFVEAAARFNVAKLVFDEHFAEQVTQEMHEATNVEREKLPQNASRLNEPTQNMERLILDHKFEHNGNPVLSWQMGHVNIKTDANGNKRPIKPLHQDHKKIDGVVATIMALAAARLTDPDDNWFRAGGGITGDLDPIHTDDSEGW